MNEISEKDIDKIPRYDEMAYYVIRVLIELNDSGLNSEIYDKVEDVLREESILTDDLINFSKPNQATTLVRSRIVWAISVLRKLEFIKRPQRSVNVLNRNIGITYEELQKDELIEKILQYQRERNILRYKLKKGKCKESSGEDTEASEDDEEEELEEESENISLSERVYQYLISMTPKDFETFCARLLRQMGLAEVFVTGQTGDQGIDIKGTLMLNDLIPQKVRVQCKRYQTKNLISAPQIQQFRGAISSEEQGIFITTSRFTEPSRQESMKEGHKRIRIIDFDELFDLMKKYQVGIEKKEIRQFELVKS